VTPYDGPSFLCLGASESRGIPSETAFADSGRDNFRLTATPVFATLEATVQKYWAESTPRTSTNGTRVRRTFTVIRVVKVLVAAGLMAGASYADIITPEISAAALVPSDTVLWGQLGSDNTIVPQSFTATSTGSRSIGGSFSTSSGHVVYAGTSWTPVTGAFANGDALVWANNGNGGTGPITLTFPTMSGVGAAIQSDAPGQFTAKLQLFAGSTALTAVTLTSDSAGDAIFIGALNNTKDVTSAVFSLTSAVSDTADLAIDTLDLRSAPAVPEPASVLLLATGLAVLPLRRSKRRNP
jgi:hypothetical protein